MSDIEKKKGDEESKQLSEPPKTKVREILSELQVLSMQKSARPSLDVSQLDKDQFEKAIDLLKQNEENAFKYHDKRLDVYRELESKRIDSSVILQNTVKYVVIGALILIPIITLLILFFKEEYFLPWLTFITGFVGGAGSIKIVSSYLEKTEREETKLEED